MDKRFGRGGLGLLVIAVGGTALTGCAPHPMDTPTQLNQAKYNTVEECRQDWDDDNLCSRPSGGTGYIHSPFYSSHGGYYYAYDGTKKQLVRQPSRAVSVSSEIMSPAKAFSGSPKYAGARSSAVSRGGFTGGKASSGGG